MKKFPEGFVWGSATSSYQIEGAAWEGGKGPSIWDVFAHTPGKTLNGDTGDVACDHYHRLEADIQLMVDMGLKHYRFSISWPRIQPTGQGEANPEGIAFYNKLIDGLLEKGITPWVTLYHWDMPAALQMEHDGWLGERMPDFFAEYARICFTHFGDRVKHWLTLNEPWVVAMLGYGQGAFAPGRTSNTEPYLAAHQLLKAHGKAVKIYREQFREEQNGHISLSNNCDWREPATDSPEDKAAAERALEFFLAWFTDPIYKGEYPPTMRENLGERLPTFTEEEKAYIKGSADFFGLNHYTTLYAAQVQPGESISSEVYGNGGIAEDQAVRLSTDPAWETTTMGWAVVPWGFRKLLHWIADRYGNPPLYVFENGCSLEDTPENGAVNDTKRIQFFEGYIGAAHEAWEQGVDLKGYFVWSLFDNFEWASGYSKRFGIHYVDFKTLQRIPKASARFMAKVMAANGL